MFKIIRRAILFAQTFILALPIFALAQSPKQCRSLFSGSHNQFVLSLLEPLRIDYLVKQVNYQLKHDPTTLDPSFDKIIYTIHDRSLLTDKNFPMEEVGLNERVVETDYGYAVMDVDTLRDWTLLFDTLKSEEASKAYIEKVAQTSGLYPKGINKESADWLRWSIIAQELSAAQAKKKFKFREEPTLDAIQRVSLAIRAEYSRLVRQKELFIFPFGTDARIQYNQMRGVDARLVLEILARYKLISHLYVKRPNNEYRLLSEFLDRDSLMLLSRFPELLPSYPLLEGGHISFPHGDSKVAYDDTYSLAQATITPEVKRSGVIFKSAIQVFAIGDGIWGAPIRNITYRFRIFFDRNKQSSDNFFVFGRFQDRELQELFVEQANQAQHTLDKKSKAFFELTGVELEPRLVDLSETQTHLKEYDIRFSQNDLPEYIKVSFFIFLALDESSQGLE